MILSTPINSSLKHVSSLDCLRSALSLCFQMRVPRHHAVEPLHILDTCSLTVDTILHI